MLHEHVKVARLGPNMWNLVGVSLDITARREAELALAAEKERLAVTLGSMSEGRDHHRFIRPRAVHQPGGCGDGPMPGARTPWAAM